MEAGQFIKSIEKRKGLKVACLEEIAYRMKYINKTQLKNLADLHGESDYSHYLHNLLKK